MDEAPGGSLPFRFLLDLRIKVDQPSAPSTNAPALPTHPTAPSNPKQLKGQLTLVRPSRPHRFEVIAPKHRLRSAREPPRNRAGLGSVGFSLRKYRRQRVKGPAFANSEKSIDSLQATNVSSTTCTGPQVCRPSLYNTACCHRRILSLQDAVDGRVLVHSLLLSSVHPFGMVA